METQKKNFSIKFSVDLPPNTIREYMNGLAKIERQKRRRQNRQCKSTTGFDFLLQILKVFFDSYKTEIYQYLNKNGEGDCDLFKTIYVNKKDEITNSELLNKIFEKSKSNHNIATKINELVSSFVSTNSTNKEKSITSMLLEIYDEYMDQQKSKEEEQKNTVEKPVEEKVNVSENVSSPENVSSLEKVENVEPTSTKTQEAEEKPVEVSQNPTPSDRTTENTDSATRIYHIQQDMNASLQQMFGIKPEDLPAEFQKNEMFKNNEMFKTLMPLLSGFLGGFANQTTKNDVQVPIPIPPKTQTTVPTKKNKKPMDISEIIKNEQERVCEDIDNGGYSKEDVDLIIKGGYSE